MTPQAARDYLVALTETHTGQRILVELGYGPIIDSPRRGDDKSTVLIAEQALALFRRRYPVLV